MAYHVFISYRRAGASELAVLLYNRLSMDGYAPFLDMEGMRSGQFDEQIYQRIDECSDVLVLLPENALNRKADEEDWVRLEIAHALRNRKNVIPVFMHGFVFPDELPEDILLLRKQEGVNANMEYFDATYQKICNLITYTPKKKSKYAKAIRLLLAGSVCLAIGAAGVYFISGGGKPDQTMTVLSTEEPVREATPLAPSPTAVSTPEPSVTPVPEQTAVPDPTPENVRNENLICFGKDENGGVLWEVLSSEEDYTELISAACIAIRPFGTSCYWEESGLRQWLNENYLFRVFSSAERDAILAVDGDAIRIPGIDETRPIEADAAIDEQYRCTYFSSTVFSDNTQLLYTISEEGALGVASPDSELGVRIIVKVKTDFLSGLPNSNFQLPEEKESGPYNMSILLDSNDRETFRVSWEGKADELWIFMGQVHAIYAERDVSGVSSFTFEHAQPNTTYTVNLYAGDKVLSQEITMPQSMRYDRFGATNYISSMTWINEEEWENGMRPWQAECTKYQPMTKEELREQFGRSKLYCTVRFTYKQASTDHQFVKKWILRMPGGDSYSVEEQVQLPGAGENHTYSFYQSVDELMEHLHVDQNTIQSGTYTVELHFDDQLVGDAFFIVI